MNAYTIIKFCKEICIYKCTVHCINSPVTHNLFPLK
uniref:Uncharacterized protein n=1 Tax=Anguilla anguilla TaxID=7936 RepID=A0A0E9X0E3_ANGAN